jgi:hypothetical protein
MSQASLFPDLSMQPVNFAAAMENPLPLTANSLIES